MEMNFDFERNLVQQVCNLVTLGEIEKINSDAKLHKMFDQLKSEGIIGEATETRSYITTSLKQKPEKEVYKIWTIINKQKAINKYGVRI